MSFSDDVVVAFATAASKHRLSVADVTGDEVLFHADDVEEFAARHQDLLPDTGGRDRVCIDLWVKRTAAGVVAELEGVDVQTHLSRAGHWDAVAANESGDGALLKALAAGLDWLLDQRS